MKKTTLPTLCWLLILSFSVPSMVLAQSILLQSDETRVLQSFNPSRGSFQRLAYKKDFDDQELLGEWELLTAEWAGAFDLGRTDRSIQRVFALNFWTAYVPTWETETVDGREVVTRRPPQYDGANLGGLDRMRAFEDSRFHDKAAVYYSAELRVIPAWQPLRGRELLAFADIRYWQWVVFAEAGQVAPAWCRPSMTICTWTGDSVCVACCTRPSAASILPSGKRAPGSPPCTVIPSDLT